jgi:hypothetical protein
MLPGRAVPISTVLMPRGRLEAMFSRAMNKNLMTVFSLSLLINGFVVLASYISVAPSGTELLLFIATFAMLPLLAAFLLIPLALVFLCWRRYRITALTTILGCVIYFAVGFAGVNLANNVRRAGFVSLAQRSRPLIAAIQQFEAQHGKPPANLEQLVPEFLPTVPKTGIGAYPKYEYFVVNDQTVYEGNSWVLRVDPPTGGLNWDAFLYFPNQNYPQVGYGGVIERVEDWAYLYE